jgi:WD40 repeat protein
MKTGEFTRHKDMPMALVFAPDGKRVLSAGFDKVLRLWDPDTGNEVRTLEGHTGCVQQVLFFPDGKHAISRGDDKTIRAWDVASGKEVWKWENRPGAARALDLSHDGRWVLYGTQNEKVRLERVPAW